MDYILIDDDRISLFLTKNMLGLEVLSERVMEFDDPEKALGFLQRQIAAGELPRVIFLDLNMPKLTGWDLLEALEPYYMQLQANCLIYLLTSSLDPLDITRAGEHPQVQELIHKPLTRDKIMKIQKSLRKTA